jgi:autotransporter-associated beta strand protein
MTTHLRHSPLRTFLRHHRLFSPWLLLAALPAAAQTTYNLSPNLLSSFTWTTEEIYAPILFFNYTYTDWVNDPVSGNNLVLSGNGGTLTLASGATLYAHQLRFTVDNYTLASANNAASLTFVGTNPGITVDTGRSVTTRAYLNGTNLQLAGGGTLRLGASNRISDTTALSIVGNSTLALGDYNETVSSLVLTAGTVSGAGSLTAHTFTVESGTLAANLTGTGALAKQGSGTVTLTTASTYTGGTTVTAGNFRLGADDVLADSGALTVTGGTFDLGSHSERVGAVRLTGNGVIAGTGSATLTGSSYVLESGTVSARLGGPGGLAKTTGGTVTLTGANSYTGDTTISAGTLRLLGSLGATATTIGAGGTLAGTGSTGGSVVVAGRLAPGDNGIGTLTTGGQTWASGGVLSLDLAALPGAGTSWDRLQLNGSLAITATAAAPFTIELFSRNALGNGAALAGFSPSMSYAWTFLTATSIPGFASDALRIDASQFNALNNANGLFWLSNSGTALTLLYSPVPEPSTVALLAGAGALGFAFWRRRRTHR